MKMTFPHEEGQYFIWVGEPLKTVSYNAGLKSTLSFLPKRQISPNQGEQEGRRQAVFTESGRGCLVSSVLGPGVHWEVEGAFSATGR